MLNCHSQMKASLLSSWPVWLPRLLKRWVRTLMPVLSESFEVTQLLVIKELEFVLACANNDPLEFEGILYALVVARIDLCDVSFVLGVYRARSRVRSQS
ncbi:hypothetical protein D3C87_1088610 [compost metagenome]